MNDCSKMMIPNHGGFRLSTEKRLIIATKLKPYCSHSLTYFIEDHREKVKNSIYGVS